MDTLHNSTGQVIDTYDGAAQVVHQPAANYIVGHGITGLAIDWVLPDEFAKQLIERRGLQAGDILCVITCFAGEKPRSWMAARRGDRRSRDRRGNCQSSRGLHPLERPRRSLLLEELPFRRPGPQGCGQGLVPRRGQGVESVRHDPQGVDRDRAQGRTAPCRGRRREARTGLRRPAAHRQHAESHRRADRQGAACVARRPAGDP